MEKLLELNTCQVKKKRRYLQHCWSDSVSRVTLRIVHVPLEMEDHLKLRLQRVSLIKNKNFSTY